ncbi:MAG: porphobilinogen synthase [Candidatus Omnitrophota bacterium]|nr:porphobilinogen synthase [Candidatus Omnitrophota bacterium]
MPIIRLRRLRKNNSVRELLVQTRLSIKDLILPYFIIEGRNKKQDIKSMPGVFRFTIDNLLKDLEEAKKLGINAILLFGIAQRKDFLGKEAYLENGIVQKAIRAIKKQIKDLVVITDVCLCGYTTHGHCGIVTPQKRKIFAKTQNFILDNDKTLEILSKIALSHTEAGCDFVAPSAMMDGQVKAIRQALDKNGFQNTGILAYSAKYASNFYGPFREVLDSRPQFSDRKSYQMDCRNSDEALREIEQDIQEGADIVMVKPALAYLDIIYRAKQKFNIPLAAYNVSAEFAMVKAYCKKPENREQRTEIEKNLVLEILTGIKRAGADLIITYHAKEVAKWLRH